MAVRAPLKRLLRPAKPVVKPLVRFVRSLPATLRDLVDPVGAETRRRFPALAARGDSTVSRSRPVRFDRLAFPGQPVSGRVEHLPSLLCTKAALDSPAFQYWLAAIRSSYRTHRKGWEWGYILQALFERGLLEPGKRGLGFAVGREPLTALMASRGCHVVATDLDPADARSDPWARTDQFAADAAALNAAGLCDDAAFRERVRYRPVDMNRIPGDLRGFDFTWSSCSFEHCGTIDLGLRFLVNQMACLKPGGVAVHTTEFNLTSDTDTAESGQDVIFRRQDLERVIRELRGSGHSVEPILLDPGTSAEDRYIDEPPYASPVHLKLRLFLRYVSTSIGMIIRKAA